MMKKNIRKILERAEQTADIHRIHQTITRKGDNHAKEDSDKTGKAGKKEA